MIKFFKNLGFAVKLILLLIGILIIIGIMSAIASLVLAIITFVFKNWISFTFAVIAVILAYLFITDTGDDNTVSDRFQ